MYRLYGHDCDEALWDIPFPAEVKDISTFQKWAELASNIYGYDDNFIFCPLYVSDSNVVLISICSTQRTKTVRITVASRASRGLYKKVSDHSGKGISANVAWGIHGAGSWAITRVVGTTTQWRGLKVEKIYETEIPLRPLTAGERERFRKAEKMQSEQIWIQRGQRKDTPPRPLDWGVYCAAFQRLHPSADEPIIRPSIHPERVGVKRACIREGAQLWRLWHWFDSKRWREWYFFPEWGYEKV